MTKKTKAVKEKNQAAEPKPVSVLSDFRRAIRVARLLVEAVIAVDTVRRVLSDPGRREAIARFGRKAQRAVAQ